MHSMNNKLPSQFRSWLQEMWMRHKDEVFTWTKQFPEYDDRYYFNKHKWMLKKMFRQEQGK